MESDKNMVISVEVIARETIKPSSPTPHHLRSYNLSFLDQYAPPVHTSCVLFYASNNTNSTFPAEDKSSCLKKSLSQALTLYYPLAGRIKDHMSVDCTDQGALYVEARAAAGTLAEILHQPNPTALRDLVTETPDSHLLIVQATSFKCGGLAIGLSVSHRLADGVSFGSFLRAWSSRANSTDVKVVVPDLISSSSLLPPLNPPPMDVFERSKVSKVTDGLILRRYVFSSSCLGKLRTRAASESVPNPTRVEVVCALLWKYQMALRSSSTKKPPAVALVVSIRPNLEPPLPEHSYGNFAVQTLVEGGGTAMPEADLSKLVGLIRSNLKEFRERFVKKLQGTGGSEIYLKHIGEVMRTQEREDLDVYIIVSWCRFGFYQADFGWGKPVWASPVPPPFLSVFHSLLMDTSDGDGIEVHMNFAGEDEIALFESNEELSELVLSKPS